MHRAVTGIASALLVLAATSALALAQGGVEGPPPAETPEPTTLYSDGHDGRYLLAGRWWFRPDPGDIGEVSGFATEPSLEGWTATTVPSAWNARDESDDSQRGTVGWYRKDFRLPTAYSELDWKLRFESVNHRAQVWLNGELLGEHERPYVPFEVGAFGLLRKGVNTLVVRVDNRRRSDDVPRGGDRANGRPTGGWWNYGGLLREVYLRKFEHVDVEKVRVRPILSPSHRRARLHFRVKFDNPTAKRVVARLRLTVDGKTRQSRPFSIGAGGRRWKRYRVDIRNPRLWEPLAPELYPIKLAAYEGDRLVSGYQLNVGIRELRVGGDGILRINGHRVKLLGASLHEDHPRRGAALTPADRERDVRLLRDLGATITRAHYPLHPHYLELADRMGLMVYDQVPVYSVGYRDFEDSAVMNRSLAYVRAMVERDWNHPSVLAWSIGNELSARMTEDQEEYITKAARLIDQLDPTRLRTIDIFGWPHTPPADVYQELDGLGINNYFGWYPGPNGQVEDRELLGPFLDQMHEYYPDMALFVTEFGAEANREGPADEKGTYAYQQDLLRHHVRTYIEKPYVNGAMAWILRDFRVRPDWEGGNPRPEPPWNQKGLADQLWGPKPAFAATAKLYKSVRPVRAIKARRRAR